MKYLILVEDDEGGFEAVFRSARKPTHKSLVAALAANHNDACDNVEETTENADHTEYVICDESGDCVCIAKVYDCGSITAI